MIEFLKISGGILFAFISFAILISDDDDSKAILIAIWVIALIAAVVMK